MRLFTLFQRTLDCCSLVISHFSSLTIASKVWEIGALWHLNNLLILLFWTKTIAIKSGWLDLWLSDRWQRAGILELWEVAVFIVEIIWACRSTLGSVSNSCKLARQTRIHAGYVTLASCNRWLERILRVDWLPWMPTVWNESCWLSQALFNVGSFLDNRLTINRIVHKFLSFILARICYWL